MLKIKIIKENKTPDRVHAKSKYLQDEEGYDKDQAYAIAYSMDEEGDLKEDQLDEISAAGGGAVDGGGGVFGDPDKVKKFNEEEKKKSKLKGTPLEEDYSTVGLKPGDAQIYMDDETNDGRIERSQQQGLQNVKSPKAKFHENWRRFIKS